jgi:FtsH-binding integral membrane protein
MQPDIRDLQPVRSDPNAFGRAPAVGEAASLQHRVLRNTYWLLAISLIPTAIGATIGTGMDWSFMRASPGLSFIVILALFYGWIYAIERNRTSGTGVGLLLGFTLFLGALLGPLLQRTLGYANGASLVTMAAGGTAVVFFAMATIASTTKRDLSPVGNFLAVGGIVIMLAVVASFFFQSPAFILAILAAFILFSSLTILWKVNDIVRGGETNYISATLTLYVAIYNLFSSLLQILGAFGGNSRN